MAKAEIKTIERTYNVPLRKEYLKAPRWNRTKKAVGALRQFLTRHMKTDQVKLGKELNEALWQHGIKNPPHHIKVTATKDDKGVVRAELFGIKKEEPKKSAERTIEKEKPEAKTTPQKETVKKTEATKEKSPEVAEKEAKTENTEVKPTTDKKEK